MVASATKKKGPRGSMKTVVHVPLTAPQNDKLKQMAAADRRRYTEFMRLLVDDEWERRQKAAAAQGNGAAA